MKCKYKSTYGLWEVTTAGDYEGRTAKILGTYQGHIDEIALYLADKQYYCLTFKHVERDIQKTYYPTKSKVVVQLDIDSETWDMNKQTHMDEMKKLFKNRPVFIGNANPVASFTISLYETNQLKFEKEQALSKLTNHEKEILGLN